MSELPVTGQAEVDHALAGLADLDQVPLEQHHERLTQAHAALHAALQGEGAGTGSATVAPRPGPRPT